MSGAANKKRSFGLDPMQSRRLSYRQKQLIINCIDGGVSDLAAFSMDMAETLQIRLLVCLPGISDLRKVGAYSRRNRAQLFRISTS